MGNDYLVLDGATFGVDLTPQRIRDLCHRNLGVGSDGILEVIAPPPGFDAAVRIHNPDGSEAEKSGNGVRIFAKFCEDHGYVRRGAPMRIYTKGGAVTAVTVARDATGTRMRVEMGTASFRCADLPMVPGDGSTEWIERKLDCGDRELTATCVSVGNPHCVIFDAPFDAEAAKTIGPIVEHHRFFPNRTNVQLIRIVDRATIRAMIWERGAGFTSASGSSACAVAAAAVRANLTDRAVTVLMLGGALEVTVREDWSLEQVGPAQEVGRFLISPEFAELLSQPTRRGTA